MITLQRLNVQKIVSSQEDADKLVSQGYHIVDAPEQLSQHPLTPSSAGDPPAPPQVVLCPICDREYKTQEGLDKHMADKHAPNDGEGGDDDDGTADPTDRDNDGGNQDGAEA